MSADAAVSKDISVKIFGASGEGGTISFRSPSRYFHCWHDSVQAVCGSSQACLEARFCLYVLLLCLSCCFRVLPVQKFANSKPDLQLRKQYPLGTAAMRSGCDRNCMSLDRAWVSIVCLFDFISVRTLELWVGQSYFFLCDTSINL